MNGQSPHRLLKRRAMGSGMLAMAIFCCVSGGPFGLEPIVQEAGPGLALLLIALMPILWALPDALTTAELAPAIPVEGGYIVWVRRAMGPFAGFLNAWWTWIYALLDAALYPILFVSYVASLLNLYFGNTALQDSSLLRWLAAMAVIAVFSWLNIRGTRLVGQASRIFAVLIIAPFALMVGLGIAKLMMGDGSLPDLSIQKQVVGGSIASAMAIAMWNYLGWDQLSTIAEEVEDPARAYPRAIFIGVPLVAAVYFLPTLVGLAYFPDAAKWEEGAWPDIADVIGGPWLSIPIVLAALVSPIALFTASLLGSSRVPFVLAEERFLPQWLVHIHPRFGTPVRAILLSAAVFAGLALGSFAEIVELNVLMYSAALVLESAALIVLRVKEPDLPRPFKIPGGYPALAIIFLLPISVALTMTVFSFQEEGWAGQLSSIVALASGPAVYGGIVFGRRLLSRK